MTARTWSSEVCRRMLRNTSINGWFIGRRKDDEGKARFMVVSPAVLQYDVVSPTMSAAVFMFFFEPFCLRADN